MNTVVDTLNVIHHPGSEIKIVSRLLREDVDRIWSPKRLFKYK
jgi:hypothetical protein